MKNEKRLIYLEDAKEALIGWDDNATDEEIEYTLDQLPTVDAVEVSHVEEVRQAILQTFDNLIVIHRDISNSPLANSAKYLDIPESSNDYNGIYADAMEVARRFVNVALTYLCGAKMDGGDEDG